MRDYFVFDDIDSRDFNCYVFPLNIDASPAREFTEVIIAGRQGTLTIDNMRNENVVHSYQGIIIGDTPEEDMENLRAALSSKIGTFRLSDSIQPDEFYNAKFMTTFDPVVNMERKAVKFNIEFNRDPQRFLLEGDSGVVLWDLREGTHGGYSYATISNPTPYDAEPLIIAYGVGVVDIGDYTITIDTAAGREDFTYIDCAMMDAYKIATSGAISSANHLVTFKNHEFPKIVQGVNNIRAYASIDVLEIVPRWWRL